MKKLCHAGCNFAKVKSKKWKSETDKKAARRGDSQKIWKKGIKTDVWDGKKMVDATMQLFDV